MSTDIMNKRGIQEVEKGEEREGRQMERKGGRERACIYM
jgi:hypothetical protein